MVRALTRNGSYTTTLAAMSTDNLKIQADSHNNVISENL
jgi:hypothetical protein